MILEFKRFGLTDFQRVATGTLQLLGAAGILTGFIMPIIGLMASSGLAIMMFVAFLVRLRIGDGIVKSAPSLLFLALNGWISGVFYSLI
jgi:Ni/Fe-hydrogenase subunit HybB-like protein